jgi:hypothetical protein
MFEIQRRIVVALDLPREVAGQQHDGVDVVGVGLGGDETSVEQKAPDTDLPGERNPSSQSQDQPPSA